MSVITYIKRAFVHEKPEPPSQRDLLIQEIKSCDDEIERLESIYGIVPEEMEESVFYGLQMYNSKRSALIHKVRQMDGIK